ncbi:MAG: hypothetical protein JWP38_3738 [Herbaspirillum sp.]|nr:hypothetical protein [Herbaspirillum sp.]
MGGTVVFNYATWAVRYPELAVSVAQPLAQEFFNEAQMYCDNTPTSIVCDLTQRTTLLSMMTAHIAALNAPIGGQPASPLVGRISSASEGSVSVQTQNDYPPGTVQWFQQTKYGSAFWATSAQFRSMQYVAGRVPAANPWGRFGPR